MGRIYSRREEKQAISSATPVSITRNIAPEPTAQEECTFALIRLLIDRSAHLDHPKYVSLDFTMAGVARAMGWPSDMIEVAFLELIEDGFLAYTVDGQLEFLPQIRRSFETGGV